jgi:hypothetical protein
MNLALAAHLAALFSKARPLRRFVAVATVVVAFVIAALTGAQAFQQSAEQQAQGSTGRADYLLALPIPERSGQQTTVSGSLVVAAMREAGAEHSRSGFDVYQVPIDGHTALWMNLTEDDWTTDPFPNRYLLVSGRLPSKPGEVAISERLAESLAQEPISLAGGALNLVVVGVIRDDTNRAAPLGLVAPGTWQTAGVSSGTFDLSATRLLYWSSEEPPRQVVEAIASELIDMGAEPPQIDDLLAGVFNHQAFHEARLYSELGVLILLTPCAVGLIGGWAGTRFIRRIRHTLLSIGIARTALAGSIALVLSALVAGFAGVGLGLLAGAALRPVLDIFSNRWLGPVYGLESFVPMVITALLVGTGLGTINIAKRDSERPLTERSSTERRRFVPSFAQLTPAASLLLVFAGIFCAQSSDLNTRFLAPFLFGSAVVIVAPLALGLTQRVRTKSLPVALAFRQLTSDRRGAAWATVGLASLLMLSFSTLLVNYSVVATSNEQALSRVPEGQAQLVPPPTVAEDDIATLIIQINDYAGVSAPVRLEVASGRLETVEGPIMIVATPRDGERLLGLSLLPGEISAMDEGALFLFNDPRVKKETVRLDTGETVSLPVVQSSETVANHSTWSGLITQKTADDLQLSSGVVTWVYPDVSERQLRALAETPGVLAFDPRWMIAYEPPAVRTEPPVTLFIGFSAGLLASLLVAYYSSAITRNLRPTLAALRSVGVRPTWLTIVTMVQVGVVILTAVLFAWLGAIVATILSTQTWITNVQLHIPWISVGVLLATLVAGALVSQLFSMRRLVYSER